MFLFKRHVAHTGRVTLTDATSFAFYTSKLKITAYTGGGTGYDVCGCFGVSHTKPCNKICDMIHFIWALPYDSVQADSSSDTALLTQEICLLI